MSMIGNQVYSNAGWMELSDEKKDIAGSNSVGLLVIIAHCLQIPAGRLCSQPRCCGFHTPWCALLSGHVLSTMSQVGLTRNIVQSAPEYISSLQKGIDAHQNSPETRTQTLRMSTVLTEAGRCKIQSGVSCLSWWDVNMNRHKSKGFFSNASHQRSQRILLCRCTALLRSFAMKQIRTRRDFHRYLNSPAV